MGCTLAKEIRELEDYAKENTGCAKVHVGAALLEFRAGEGLRILLKAANECLPNTCRTSGCNRIRLYGDDSKNHRLPSDCNAIHSEQNLICKANSEGYTLDGRIVLVTRYPCETCARMLIKSNVAIVYYCRSTPPSDITIRMFEEANIPLIHLSELDGEDSQER